MPVEGLHPFNDLPHVIMPLRTVHPIDIFGVDGVQLQDVVIHPHQGVVHLRAMNHRRVAQHTHLRLRTIRVAQLNGVVYNLGKVRMTRRLAVASICQHIRQLPLSLHLLQFQHQPLRHLLACWHGKRRTMVLIESTLTVYAVKAAHLTVCRQQVDAQRYAQSTAMYGAENRRRIDNSTHNVCKSTKKN